MENNKYTNEQSPIQPTGPVGSPTAAAERQKFERGIKRQPTITQRRTFRQEKAPTVIGGKMQVSHTVYDRIGALISERRSDDTDKRKRGSDRRKVSILRQMGHGVEYTTINPLRLHLQGYYGSGSARREPPAQHREKSPG
ncbi:MAG TPA: hypothetical protein EYN64_05915 [Flavobacteriales bacterium]|nr:hypothetical protein [Flavobacteriales bacterium]